MKYLSYSLGTAFILGGLTFGVTELVGQPNPDRRPVAANAPVRGDELPINGSKTCEPGDLCVLWVDATGIAEVKWQTPPALDGKHLIYNERDATGVLVKSSLIFASKTPGEYTVVAYAGTNVRLGQHTVVNGTPKPPDPPNPPNPPDPPTPINTKYNIGFFVESGTLDNLTSSQRAVLASLTFRNKLKAAGHKWFGEFDPQTTGVNPDFPIWLKPWATIAANRTPCVLLQPISGGEVKRYDFPADEAALEKLLAGGATR